MEKINLQGVPETMLQTLYARAAYSKTANAKFHDSMAEQIVSRISPEYTWVRDVSLVEGMKAIMPIYHLLGWIPAVKSISNKLAVLKKQKDVDEGGTA